MEIWGEKCPAARAEDRERFIRTTMLIMENQTPWRKARGVAERIGVEDTRNFRKLEVLITLAAKGCNGMLNLLQALRGKTDEKRNSCITF